MTDYGSTGAHQINAWLWNKLKDFVWTGTEKAFEEYGPSALDIIPIIPSQQIPELNDISSGAPYIVYNYRTRPKVDFYMKYESCAYVLYDSNEARLRAVHNYLLDLLERWDWTARNVNSYLGNSKYDFKSVYVTMAQGPEPATEQGGRQAATIVIAYEFTVANDGTEGSTLRV